MSRKCLLQHSIIQSALIAATLLLVASLSPALENKLAPPGETKATTDVKATKRSAEPRDPR